MITVFAYAVYILIGIFAIRFIFWDVPKHFSSYWKGVSVAAVGVIVLAGLGFLAQKDENATFWLSLLIILLIAGMMFVSSRRN